MNKYMFFSLLIFAAANISGCKEDFLEIKQNQNLVIPATIADYQGLLDNKTIINNDACSELGIIGSDEYSISDASWGTLANAYQKNAYIWAKDVYEGNSLNEWNKAYWRILYANTALDGAATLKPSAADQNDYNNLKGSAFFIRAFNFYQLAQTFAPPYNAATANTDMGIPLRLEADINLPSKRASIAQTYQQIISDLQQAAELLPQPALFKSRPSKAAAYALLAKTYLQMGNYEKAAANASESLKLNSSLNDFNTLNLSARYIFSTDEELNPEVTFSAGISAIAILTVSRINIPTTIVNSYSSNDLRKQGYFFNNTDGRILFKGSFRGSSACFTGLSTSETWLVLAEGLARTGQLQAAMDALNTLRKARYSKTGYTDLTAADQATGLQYILSERKKELLLRGTRWEDLRRQNQEPAFAITLSRTLNGNTYTLEPGSNRHTWPIPDNEISLSNLTQNPR